MRKLDNNELWVDRLIRMVRTQFEKIQDNRVFSRKLTIKLSDCLMSCFAVFSLKWPSLLQYQANIRNEPIRKNLKLLYGIEHPPSDTYIRERLDKLDPVTLAPVYKKLFSLLQRNKILESYQYLNGCYLLSIDGTAHFSSEKVHCKNCCVKELSKGKMTYYHQLLGVVLVHPEQKAVIPLCPEAIRKEDGETKNDCERNASKRLLERVREDHPYLKVIVVEDGLSSNAPHIRELERHKMSYILGVKEGDHLFLFDWVRHAEKIHYEYRDEKGLWHRFKFINRVPLNDANFDLKVNFLEYEEETPKGKKKRFSWVTNIELTKNNVTKIMRGGRARWSIENETFNTLKNQGYEFEHNFGHGNENLCTVMGMIMLLAFLVDQVQLLCCQLYKKAKDSVGTFKSLWEHMRSLCSLLIILGWEKLYKYITRETRIDTS